MAAHTVTSTLSTFASLSAFVSLSFSLGLSTISWALKQNKLLQIMLSLIYKPAYITANNEPEQAVDAYTQK